MLTRKEEDMFKYIASSILLIVVVLLLSKLKGHAMNSSNDRQ